MDRYDVAIIGGGLTGCASAYYLAKLGASVLVVDAAQFNSGASGRNAGSLHFQLEHRLVAHADALGDSLVYLVRLSRFAVEQWRNLEAELDCDLELAMHGGLMAAETDEDIALLHRKQAIERRCGLATELLGGAELRTRAPYLDERVRAAAFCADEGRCNPRLLTPAFLRRAAERGAEMRAGVRVAGIRRVPGAWQIDFEATPAHGSGAERVAAAQILDAAGAWAGRVAALAGYHLPIFPVGLLMSVTEKADAFIPHLVQHVGKRITIKQVADGNVLIGGGWPAPLSGNRAELSADAQARVTLASLSGNLEAAVNVVPALGELNLVRTWTGVTGVTSDQLPIIGEIPRSRGLYVAAGGGAGFTFGPTYAFAVAELMSGRSPPLDIGACSPARFDHVNMFMG